MCLIFFAIDQHPEYKLVIAGNRDEFYNRKTAPAGFWPEYPEVLGGRDLEAMGTWLGMTKAGRISMLTNYRDVANLKHHAPSRGKLVSDFLIRGEPAQTYLKTVATRGQDFNGFNLIAGDVDALWYYSNYGDSITHLGTGTFGLSNHLLDTPWPKVKRGKAHFERILASGEVTAENLFSLLLDEEIAPDETLPATGLPLERERALSSMFIKTPDYGSRCSTVIMVSRNNQVFFSERVFDLRTFEYNTQTFEFALQA
jgi:uncharacterized protein with NRDE domain